MLWSTKLKWIGIPTDRDRQDSEKLCCVLEANNTKCIDQILALKAQGTLKRDEPEKVEEAEGMEDTRGICPGK